MPVTAAHQEYLCTLLERVGRGDRSAFREFHGFTAHRLLPYARRIVRSIDQAEDILQESFIALWCDARSFDRRRASAMTWAVAIVRNKAIDSVRASAVRQSINWRDDGDTAASLVDPGARPDETVERKQREQRLDRSLIRLDKSHRQAIELAFFDELTHPEVAREMAIPLGTVKTWIRRGCLQMRRQGGGLAA